MVVLTIEMQSSQCGPLPVLITELTSKLQLQLAAVNGYSLNMLPPLILTGDQFLHILAMCG